jgi:hypothetical protein
MGSSGGGRFSDYSGTPKNGEDGSASGGSSGTDKCGEAFTVGLEDVASHPFFTTNGTVPLVGTVLTIALAGRIVAVTAGQTVGSLPTSFNYLAACLADGMAYSGVVVSSSAGTNPQVQADFAAT